MPTRDPLTGIPSSRHPFQVWLMFAMILSGAGNLFTPGSEVLQEGLDPLMHKTWGLTILLSGVLVTAGAFWRDRITGLLLERIGLVTLGVACPAYVIVVSSVLGVSSGVVGIALTASVGLASLWRARHVNKELRTLRDMIAREFGECE